MPADRDDSSVGPLDAATTGSGHAAGPTGSIEAAAPSVSLPKGGGALRSIGEKFATNPVTGTGSLAVPLPVSLGRSGFTPHLTLGYDSGAGNGTFGLGWGLSLPAITRKTDKGIPRYADDNPDADAADVFILSDAEDLTPLLVEKNGEWVPDAFHRNEDGRTWNVRRYRPRVEASFARIERWTDAASGDTHWRTTSRGNVTAIYGRTAESRIADPANAQRVFSWLVCASYDDNGNAIVYRYAAENADDVDVALANERHRVRTANRYVKRIKYGNRTSNRDGEWRATDPQLLPDADWMFEVVFDYGEHAQDAPAPGDAGVRIRRNDPFSSFRAGFEIRTYRLCQRVLMFHHFEGEEAVGLDCLVRSVDLVYRDSRGNAEDRRRGNPILSVLASITERGYRRKAGGGYTSRALPPLALTYSEAVVDAQVRALDAESLRNLPAGVDGARYRWIDLRGEGTAGVLSEQGGTWFYKRNLSPLGTHHSGDPTPPVPRFGPVEVVAARPNATLTAAPGPQAQFMDLAGDGRPDLVILDRPVAGFYEHQDDDEWAPFQPFASSLTADAHDPNLKFVDLNGDGLADVLVTEHEVFTWYQSQAEEGFGPATRTYPGADEEQGPALVFADETRSIYLADMSGDGLHDLVRVRNGEVCYWPNLGYGRFGAKVTMDAAPWFDAPDLFDQRRLRLVDVDGTGAADLIYLKPDGVSLFFNQAGNSWSAPRVLSGLPLPDDLSIASIGATDLFGSGTACLVWSSPLPAASRQMLYVDLMSGRKPHLLTGTVNNLGVDTRIHYASSTKFALQDEMAGRPWVTRLPFPVQVVERVETFDRVSGNLFVQLSAYHHGYFDGIEREFCGFGMVEQWDTAEMAALTGTGTLPPPTNVDLASHVPPVLTRAWYHTGAFIEEPRVSRQFAHEYNREGDTSDAIFGLTDDQLRAQSLDDTALPTTIRLADGTRAPYTLTPDERFEACRALRGRLLRQELYGLDGTDAEDRPYTTHEYTYTIEILQPRAGEHRGAFYTHERELLTFDYERQLVQVNGVERADPRVLHEMTLEADAFGAVLREAAIHYRRRALPDVTQPEQLATHVTLTARRVANVADQAAWYRVGVPVETQVFEVVKPPDPQIIDTRVMPFGFAQMQTLSASLFPLTSDEPAANARWPYEDWDWRTTPAHAPAGTRLRLIERVRTQYRRDDLTGLAPLGVVESLALPGERYTLALTADLVGEVFVRRRQGQPPENLLPTPAALLEGHGADEGGYAAQDGAWWIPSGRTFLSPNAADSPAQELAFARQHFFRSHRFENAFGQSTAVTYDVGQNGAANVLLVASVRDAAQNETTASYDYRVLQAKLVTDPNRNRTAVAFDALGMVVATAVSGKTTEALGDLLEGLELDPSDATLQQFAADPLTNAAALLGKASTRVVYDPNRFARCGQPPFAATLEREQHFQDPGGAASPIRVSFSYGDGFGRELQKKVQAETGDAPQRLANVGLPSGDVRPGALVRDGNGVPVTAPATPRWVGTGRKVYNNKGRTVREYEPFFSATHLFEDEHDMTDTGVSPVWFYDPLDRIVVTLNPNHTYQKVVIDAWRRSTHDVNDTVTHDPRTDLDAKGYVAAYFATQPVTWATWHAQRIGNQLGAAERDAAQKAALHADTPTVTTLDAKGRLFLTVVDNGVDGSAVPQRYATRLVLDAENNRRETIDARDRVVMRHAYDIAGRELYQASMEAGERWVLPDATATPIRAWDSRGLMRRSTYDALRRMTGRFVTKNGVERQSQRIVYGEAAGDADNHRTRVRQVFDGAGSIAYEAYDFKGNLLRTRRALLVDYAALPDWQAAPALEAQTFVRSVTYDALNRIVTATTPDGSVYRPTFNLANLLDRVDVNLRGAAATTAFVTDISYNAKAQRTAIAYENGAVSISEYDPLTFRLARLRTTRPANPDSFASQLFQNASVVQDLRYTYDPIGNTTRMEDAALRTIFHNGEQIDPVCSYSYDPLYRLKEARGREHIAQSSLSFNERSRRDWPFAGPKVHPADTEAFRNYTQQYDYDRCDNIGSLRHVAAAGNWTRTYDYEEASLLEPASKSNRLTRSHIGGQTETYDYLDAQGVDVLGSMTAIDSLKLAWNEDDELQQIDLSGGRIIYYQSDANGQRVRKVLETAPGVRKSERLYLEGFEIYRERAVPGGAVTLERETLDVMDDRRVIALVDTRTQGNDGSPAVVQRYQHSNLLGSVGVELDDQAALIAYEEYHPYGTTAFQAARSAAEVRLKRYRFVGKERDEESGLYYYGARYCAPWLGRWTACDPAGFVDGLNLYAYVKNNSVRYIDPEGLGGEEGKGDGEGKGSGDTSRGRHGEGKKHTNRTRDDHQTGDSRAAREQKKAEEKERQRQKEQRKKNPKKETDTERKQRENEERKERYKKESDKDQKENDKPDPEKERKQREQKERERRFKEEERKAAERKEEERKQREQQEKEQREREQKEREQKEREEREQKEREQKEKDRKERRRLEEADKPLEKPSLAAEAFGILVLSVFVFVAIRGFKGGSGGPAGEPAPGGGGFEPAWGY